MTAQYDAQYDGEGTVPVISVVAVMPTPIHFKEITMGG